MRSPRTVAAAVVLLLPAAAEACPYCQSSIGREVAAAIFNDRFLVTLGQAMLPLLFLAAIVAEIRLGLLWPDDDRRSRRVEKGAGQ